MTTRATTEDDYGNRVRVLAPIARSAVDQLAHTDLGNARRLVKDYGHNLRWLPQLGTWLAWDGTRFAEDVTGEVQRCAKAIVDEMLIESVELAPADRSALIKHHLKSSAAGRLRAMEEVARTEPEIPVTVDQLDSDKWLLNCRNGVVDLRTGELLPHDRSMLMTKVAGCSYEPDAVAPRWGSFVLEVFDGDEELAGFVQRYAGYSLTGEVSEQMMIFAYGNGANGKSTMFNQIRSIAGDYGLQIDPRLLTAGQHDEHPTGLTDLRGARLVTTIETEAGRALAEALLKQLTGGEPVRARRMRADYFQFDPTHKLWFAGNHLPRVRGTDHGIWRRIAVVPFEVSFEGAKADKGLAEKLSAEASGILRWMVEGCLAWQRDGLCVPDRVRAATADWRQREDQLGRFLEACCVTHDDAYVSTKDLREAYEAWCTEEGERPQTAQAVGRELTARGFDSARIGQSRTRSWIGLGVLSPGGDQI